MGEGRRLDSQGAVEQDLLRSIGQMVVAADDVRDTHPDVVGDHREVVGRRAVGAEKDEVLDLLVVELGHAVDEVIERCRPLGNQKAHRVWPSLPEEPLLFLLRQRETGPVVAPDPPLALGELPARVERLPGAKAAECVP